MAIHCQQVPEKYSNFVSCTTSPFEFESFVESIEHDYVIQFKDLLFNTYPVRTVGKA